eukprot:m51a1_g441 hypothetical protein (409) ;mRNA; r:79230-81147
MPDGSLSERYNFGVRSLCTHEEVTEAWITATLGAHTVVSTTSPRVPPAVPRRLIVRVTTYVQRDAGVTAAVVLAVDFVRRTVAGCISNVVRYLPGAEETRFVVVSAWESQQALASADEFYERVRRLDMQRPPPVFPRVVLVSEHMELVVPAEWRERTNLNALDIFSAGRRAAVCCRDGEGWDKATDAECPVCLGLLSVHSKESLCCKDASLPADDCTSERYSFSIRALCTHLEASQAWIKMRLGDHTVVSTTPFSLNKWRHVLARRSPPPARSQAVWRTTARSCKILVAPATEHVEHVAPAAGVPRRVIVRVTIHVQHDTREAATAMVVNAVDWVRDNVAGCVNNVVKFLPAARTLGEARFVVVSVWESQQALANADEFYQRCVAMDSQVAPTRVPRVVLISDVRSVQ